jgi:hypothetical protein
MQQLTNDEAGDVEKANIRTVDALQRAYAIVIVLALTTGVKLLIEVTGFSQSTGGAHPAVLPTVLLFIAFVLTLVVFYHGMNRHLDDTFVTGTKKIQRPLLLLIDIFVFLVEAALLVVMANSISNPSAFLYSWSALLAVDILWGLFVYLFVRRVPPAKWVANNAFFLVIAWILWLFFFPQNAILIAVVEIARNVVDYQLNWRFYFPSRGDCFPCAY